MNVKEIGKYLDGEVGKVNIDQRLKIPYVNEGPVDTVRLYHALNEGEEYKAKEPDTESNYMSVLGIIGNFLKNLLFGKKYEVQDIDNEFEYVDEYEGKPVYAGSNGAIGRLLDEYGDPGHGSDKINYGAAFEDRIFVNDLYVNAAAYGGRVDPLSKKKLQYILEHEVAELEGLGHDRAHERAEQTTGFSRVRF